MNPSNIVATARCLPKLWALAASVLLAWCDPVGAQVTVNGTIARVTLTSVHLVTGQTFSKAGSVTVNLSVDSSGSWTDLHAGDSVRLTLNAQRQVVRVEVTGHRIAGRIEQSLTELRPVEGDWEVSKDVTVNGRVFDVAGCTDAYVEFNRRFIGKVVFANREHYDLLEVWVGYRGGRGNGKNWFTVLGDGEELFKSEKMGQSDPAVKVSVAIKGYSGVSLISEGDEDVGHYKSGVWANPVFVRLPATIPEVVAPGMNEIITSNTAFVWKGVEGASGYLLELQCTSLLDPADRNAANRFLAIQVPGGTTVYTFDVSRMPRGKWRWRVHSLTRTGLLGEMASWRQFVSR